MSHPIDAKSEQLTLRVETMGHAPDKLAIRLSCCLLNFFTSRGAVPKRNVARDCAGEKHRILREFKNVLDPSYPVDVPEERPLSRIAKLMA